MMKHMKYSIFELQLTVEAPPNAIYKNIDIV